MTGALGQWGAVGWPDLVVPLSVFLATFIVLLWLRRQLAARLGQWAQRTRWEGDDILYRVLGWPSVLWAALIAIYLGAQLSMLPGEWKVPLGRGLWTLFILSTAFYLTTSIGALLALYAEWLHISAAMARKASLAATALVLVLAILSVLDLWGAPLGPPLLLIGLLAVGAGLALRDLLPGLLMSLHIRSTGEIEVGDYIRLESGEEGYVEDIGWSCTHLRSLDQSTVVVPNTKLTSTTVVNYGRPLKRAKEPFRLYSRTHLTELTGLKARDLKELVEILREVPESVVYYHTHHFLEEHHYLTPEPPNDFGLWVTDVLGDEVLGERLAAVDTFEFPTLGSLRERLVGIMEEHLALARDHRQAPEGEEFHFIKSVSFVAPTPYVVHDLREMVEVLRKLPLGSLYFHMFESRMRLGRGGNDFSIWLATSLGEEQLAEEIARLDPYNYTLEELRSLLIKLLEKRVK